MVTFVRANDYFLKPKHIYIEGSFKGLRGPSETENKLLLRFCRDFLGGWYGFTQEQLQAFAPNIRWKWQYMLHCEIISEENGLYYVTERFIQECYKAQPNKKLRDRIQNICRSSNELPTSKDMKTMSLSEQRNVMDAAFEKLAPWFWIELLYIHARMLLVSFISIISVFLLMRAISGFDDGSLPYNTFYGYLFSGYLCFTFLHAIYIAKRYKPFLCSYFRLHLTVMKIRSTYTPAYPNGSETSPRWYEQL